MTAGARESVVAGERGAARETGRAAGLFGAAAGLTDPATLADAGQPIVASTLLAARLAVATAVGAVIEAYESAQPGWAAALAVGAGRRVAAAAFLRPITPAGVARRLALGIAAARLAGAVAADSRRGAPRARLAVDLLAVEARQVAALVRPADPILRFRAFERELELKVDALDHGDALRMRVIHFGAIRRSTEIRKNPHPARLRYR